MAVTHRPPRTVSGFRPQTILDVMRPLVPAIAGVFGRNCEVVLHDLRTPEHSIVAIANGHVTGRHVGGPIVGGPLNDLAQEWLQKLVDEPSARVYETRTPDGRRLKSTSIIYRDEDGRPVVDLCINYDLTPALAAGDLISELTRIEPAGEIDTDTSDSEAADFERTVDRLIRESLAEAGVVPERMAKRDRIGVIRAMDAKGIFMIRGSVQRLARVLGVSKFTVYAYLDEIRNS